MKIEEATGGVLCKKIFSEFHKIHRKTPVSVNTCSLIKKETLAQVFSCEFCEISENTFYKTTPGDCFWKIAAAIQRNQRCIHDSVKPTE